MIRIKQPRLRRQCLALLLATACSAQVTAQQSTQSFAKWASNRVVPLDTVEPGPDVSDLRPLRSLIGSAKVVAIGEPGHGNHEPLSFRNRLFTFLVAEMGFTAIAIESGLSESGRVQEFVAGGLGIASQITRDNLTYGFGSFQRTSPLFSGFATTTLTLLITGRFISTVSTSVWADLAPRRRHLWPQKRPCRISRASTPKTLAACGNGCGLFSTDCE